MPQDAGIEVAAQGKSATLNELQSSLPLDLVISSARACSVRADSTLQDVAGWVRQRWDIELRIAQVSTSCGGVTNSYADVSRMGIDRWLAASCTHQVLKKTQGMRQQHPSGCTAETHVAPKRW